MVVMKWHRASGRGRRRTRQRPQQRVQGDLSDAAAAAAASAVRRRRLGSSVVGVRGRRMVAAGEPSAAPGRSGRQGDTSQQRRARPWARRRRRLPMPRATRTPMPMLGQSWRGRRGRRCVQPSECGGGAGGADGAGAEGEGEAPNPEPWGVAHTAGHNNKQKSERDDDE